MGGCSDNVNDTAKIKQPVDINYPVDIEFTELSIPTYFQWINLEPYAVYLINSQEEMMPYISMESSYMPIIDFDKYSLIISYGGTTSNVDDFKKQLQQISVNEYNLTLEIILGLAAVTEGWYLSILTPKLPQNAVLKLDINVIKSAEEPCNCFMDTLKGEWSWIETSTAKHGIIKNEYKSVIKILNKNEDATINYETYAADTLFAKGKFKINAENGGGEIKADIKLPHRHLLTDYPDWILFWRVIRYDNITKEPLEEYSKDTLVVSSGIDDDDIYYYQRIK
jgi:hypothetical protein